MDGYSHRRPRRRRQPRKSPQLEHLQPTHLRRLHRPNPRARWTPAWTMFSPWSNRIKPSPPAWPISLSIPTNERKYGFWCRLDSMQNNNLFVLLNIVIWWAGGGDEEETWKSNIILFIPKSGLTFDSIKRMMMISWRSLHALNWWYNDYKINFCSKRKRKTYELICKVSILNFRKYTRID